MLRNKKIIFGIWLIGTFLLFSFINAPKTSAATINVNTTDDSSITNCTLRDAISSTNNNSDNGACVGAGGYGDDVINIPAGTYLLSSDLPGIDDTGNSIDLIGGGRTSTIIDGNSKANICIHLSTNIVDALVSGLTSKSCNGAGIRFNNSGTKQGSNLETYDNSSEGITSLSPSGANIFSNIISHNNVAEAFSILSHTGPGNLGNTLSNMVLYESPHWGMGIQSDSITTINNVSVVNNTGSVALWITGNGSVGVTNSTIADNISTNTGGVQIGDLSTTPSVSFKNTTIANNSSSGHIINVDGVLILDGSSATFQNVLITNNGVGNCGGSYSGVNPQQPTSLGNNISNDSSCTSFVQSGDKQNQDAKIGSLTSRGIYYIIPLLEGSPAVDGGATISGIVDDQVGTSRPQGTAYDVGAIESGFTLSDSSSSTNSNPEMLVKTGQPLNYLHLALPVLMILITFTIRKIHDSQPNKGL